MNQSSSLKKNSHARTQKESEIASFVNVQQSVDQYFVDGESVTLQIFESTIDDSDPIEGNDEGWRVMKPYRQQMQHKARMHNWNLEMAVGYDPYNNYPAPTSAAI